jgi:hypothetical protein
MSERDVRNHDAVDVLVSYDIERNEIRYTALSTGAVLLIQNCNEPRSVESPFSAEADT